MVVMDDHTCMVEVARFFMNFTQNESWPASAYHVVRVRRECWKLERIVAGKGTPQDLDLLEELSETITDTALRTGKMRGTACHEYAEILQRRI